MSAPDPAFMASIAARFAEADAATSNAARGAALEMLIRDAFSSIDGVQHWRSRFLNSAASAEFDVCFQQDNRISPIHDLGQPLVVECKNTAGKVTAPTVRTFASKLDEVRLKWGVLVAAQGITGSGKRRSAAHDVIDATWLRLGVGIIVVTRTNLEALTCPKELSDLLIDRMLATSLRSIEF